jgi:ABC-type transport system involved in cytochrome c biogenesis permease component
MTGRAKTMLEAIISGALTLGPIIFLMLLPVLIPVFTIGVSALYDRAKAPTKRAEQA